LDALRGAEEEIADGKCQVRSSWWPAREDHYSTPSLPGQGHNTPMKPTRLPHLPMTKPLVSVAAMMLVED
jgi:hypothetical protein